MINAKMLLLGFYEYKVEKAVLPEVFQLFLKVGIYAKQSKFGFIASSLNQKEIESLLAPRVEFTRSKMKGIGGFIVNNSKKVGIWIAVALVTLLCAFSKNVIWDVRIEGNEVFCDSDIKKELSSCGFEVGILWSNIDTGVIETDLLSKSERVSWININRRGTVAYVKIIEKHVSDTDEKYGFSNVVAVCDAVIEEITVVNGVAKVKVGDSVKAGDLLISGAFPEEVGGGFCYAEGVVKGRVSDSINVKLGRIQEEKTLKSQKLAEIKLNFFKFSINIFKSYRNSDTHYDIISKGETMTFLGRDLPIGYQKTYAIAYELQKTELTDDELVSLASIQMREKIAERTNESTLVKLSTYGYYDDDYYNLNTDLICIEDITKDAPFDYSAKGER